MRWPTHHLKEHLEQRLDYVEKQAAFDREYNAAARQSIERAATLAAADAEKAVLKAEQAVNERMNLANETKAAMLDQQRTFATRTSLEATDDRLGRMEKALTERITSLNQALTGQQSKSLGMGQAIGMLATGIAAGSGITAILVNLM